MDEILDSGLQQETDGAYIALRPNRQRRNLAKTFVIISMAYGVFAVFPMLLYNADFDLDILAVLWGMSGLVELGIIIAAGIIFIQWFRQSYWNLHETKMVTARHRESWAVWGWFVPIVSLFFPPQIMSDIHKGYHRLSPEQRDRDRADESNGPLVGWWIFYLLSQIAGQVLFRVDNSDFIDPDLTSFYFLSAFLDVLAGVFLIIQMNKIGPIEDEVIAAANTGRLTPPND